jgi:hypothetical protein
MWIYISVQCFGAQISNACTLWFVAKEQTGFIVKHTGVPGAEIPRTCSLLCAAALAWPGLCVSEFVGTHVTLHSLQMGCFFQ